MTRADTILVTGSREWTDYGTVRAALVKAISDHGAHRLVHGGARGLDHMAARIWRAEFDLDVYVYDVDDKVDGPWPGAGPARNRRMVLAERKRIAHALAFSVPGRGPLGLTNGTAHCVGELLRQRLPVTIRVMD